MTDEVPGHDVTARESGLMARIRRFFDAENEFCRAAPGEGDISVMLNELDPDVVIEVPASLPHGGVWRGHAGFAELFELVPARWQVFEVISDSADWRQIDDDRVLVEGSLRGRLSGADHVVEMRVVSIFTYAERGISHLVHFYQDTAAFLPADRPGTSRSGRVLH